MTTKNELLKKVIRAKCIDCCVYKVGEVRLCVAVNCALHPFRMGKDPNPNRKWPGKQPKPPDDEDDQK